VLPENVNRFSLLARSRWAFNAATVLALVGCVVLRLSGVTGLPLMGAYVLLGTSITLACCAYCKANILDHPSGMRIPAATLAASLTILADQLSGGAIMEFNLPLAAACGVIALLSFAALAILGRLTWR
jgi:uncharacterized membrane protein